MLRILLVVTVTAFAALVIGLRPFAATQAPDTRSHVFSDVTIKQDNTLITGQTIVITDGIITQIRPTLQSDPAALCKHCVVTPGLIDLHVHSPPSVTLGAKELFGYQYLLHGVTSIRDVGSSDSSIDDWQIDVSNGDIIGPNVHYCDKIFDGNPASWPASYVASSADELNHTLNTLVKQPIDCIKTYNGLTRPYFQIVQQTAKQHGIPLIGHVPHAMNLLELDQFEVQHFTGLPYTHNRNTPTGSDWLDEDLLNTSEQELATAVDHMAANNVALLPTLVNSRRRLIASDSETKATSGAAMLPSYFSEFWQVGMGHPTTAHAIDIRYRSIDQQKQLIMQLHQANALLLIGTDTLMPYVTPGDSLIEEVGIFESVLGSFDHAHNIATGINGEQLITAKTGRIEEGYRADLLFYPSEPTSAEQLPTFNYVMVNGRLYEQSWLRQHATQRLDKISDATLTGVIDWGLAKSTALFAHY